LFKGKKKSKPEKGDFFWQPMEAYWGEFPRYDLVIEALAHFS